MPIKLTKAIEILTLDKTCDFEGDANDLEQAIQLGIEAMKAFRKIRTGEGCATWELLPGEQPEEIAK